MLKGFLGLTIKDWLIIITLVILFFSVLRIRKLKKTVSQEVKKRLFPQLTLGLNVDADVDKTGLFLYNQGFFLVREISVADIEVTLTDQGFKQDFILKFDKIDFLKPKENIKLEFKVYGKDQEFLPRVTESMVPHLVTPSFKVSIHYSNIENLKLYAVFYKRGAKFFSESIESDA
ncbi:MAG: hypothetical protein KKC42_01950 [Candidatus Omnitrophica bacterium]|nr:hypothetical protein [Candidatus Omnitrophota bacterium]